MLQPALIQRRTVSFFAPILPEFDAAFSAKAHPRSGNGY
jgi:hypothetical protein